MRFETAPISPAGRSAAQRHSRWLQSRAIAVRRESPSHYRSIIILCRTSTKYYKHPQESSAAARGRRPTTSQLTRGAPTALDVPGVSLTPWVAGFGAWFLEFGRAIPALILEACLHLPRGTGEAEYRTAWGEMIVLSQELTLVNDARFMAC